MIVMGTKKIEHRSWATDYRGPLIIHAAKSNSKIAREFLSKLPYPDEWPGERGGVIGVVELYKVTPNPKKDGHYLWHLRKPRRTQFIPASGKLKLWMPDATLLRHLKRRK
jgi:hypothetical protein